MPFGGVIFKTVDTPTQAWVMATWAKLADRPRTANTPVSLEALHRMLNALGHDETTAAHRLGQLLEETKALYPGIGDPLGPSLDLGSHRWLSRANENSYSDWLAWIIERQDHPSLILPLFGMSLPQTRNGRWTVEREVITPDGRLDLLLRNPQIGALCVEVKTESDPGEGQLERYLSWVAVQQSQLGLVLLAIQEPESPRPEKCRFCSWKDISLRLRSWATAWLSDPNRIYDAVLTLAFCGAIETNLLSLRTSGVNAVRTADYIEEVLAYAKA